MASTTALKWGAAAVALTWGSAALAQEPPAKAPETVSAVETAAEPAPEPPPPPPPAPTVAEAIAKGKPIFEARLRYETVDQVGIVNKADARTLRTRLGWETGAFHGLKALVEFEDVRRWGPERYNIAVPGVVGGSLNGKTQYPIVNDPKVTELNRAQLSWVVGPALTLVGGRQRILLDDQRFVGNVGWRQDEQTFDGIRADFALGRIKGTYAYISHVNRIFGEAKDWTSDSHLLNVSYSVAEPLKLQGFVYALDFGNSPINSTKTWGAKASGKTWVSLFQVAYNATWAHQSDYRHNTAPFSLDYWGGDVAATFDIWTAKASYEVLDGDGTRGFITPLATTHGFQGWADAFAAVSGNKTFVDGIKDLNLQLVARPRFKMQYLYNFEFLARWHDFDAQRTGAALGHEWDLQATAAVTPTLSVGLKYADFERVTVVAPGTAAPPASRNKFWFTLEYRL
ncbi:MAG TPA: alginate export family protein [Caulobacteraceae bacterium]|jgi:hypothetical protein|nr:alginate export family protein [Caulobacteraceae bacterium]